MQRVPVERPPQHQRLPACSRELLRDVGDDAAVRGRRGREDWRAVRQPGEQGADAPVVRPEVVTPVGDAVRLVDDEQPGACGEARQHGVPEAGIVQPLRADQQDVDLTLLDTGVDLLPVLHVARVDGHRSDPGPRGGGDLVAHQREQRTDDDRRSGAGRPQQRGRDEVDRRLAPAGALHDQRSAAAGHQRLDRRPLVLAQDGRVTGE